MARNWAIAIGINEYDNLPDLKYAVNDAELMSEWFKNEAKFDQVYLFTDSSPDITDGSKPFSSQPNRDNLRRFLRTRFEKPFLSAGDNLWFFFSGHGMRHADRDYLMPSGVDPHPEEIENSGIPLAFVTERLRRCGADNVVLILDACRDEDSSRGQGIGEEKQQGVITIASCSPAERSYEIEKIEQGSFTYSLLQGLRIHGEGNCATVERLYQYLRYRVPEINRKYRRPRQTPYAIAEPATKYHLILLPEKANLKDAETLKMDALNEEVNRNYDLAERIWIRVLMVSPGDLDAIKGIRRLAQGTSKVKSRRDRRRNNDSQSRSGAGNLPRSLPSLPSIPINISRRRLIQIVGFTATGVGITYVAGKGQEWISDLNIPEQESSSSNDVEIKQETSESQPKLELVKSEPFEVITVNVQGKEIKKETRQVEYFREDLGNSVSLDMVSVPGGKILMGTEDEEIERLVKKYDKEYFRREKPQHEVTIKTFYMGKYQVTQAQWQGVMGNNPSLFKESPQNPVEKVSWNEAVEFCEKLSEKTGKLYRLPSEAEWEYGCRAGTTTPFYFGETITGKLANYDASRTYGEEGEGEYRQKTTEVGIFPPNAYGLYDTHGNVWEWCEDDWHENYKGAPIDGRAWLSEDSGIKVMRGGSCVDDPDFCRSAVRNGYNRVVRDVIIGFRVVCVASRTT